MSSSTSGNPRRVTTPVGRLSYPHLFTPQEPFRNAKGEPQGDPKYSGVLIFDEEAQGSDKFQAMKKAVTAAGIEKFGEAEFKKLLKGKRLRLPFRDDWEDKGYPENSVYINAKSSDQPGIVDRYADPSTGKARRITDQEEVYPGMYAVFSVTAFGYDVNGNKGIAFAINNVQKWEDGERLDSRVAAEDEFDAEAPVEADLSDMDEDEDETDTAEDSEDEDDLAAFM